ncbi:DDE-type integrase/transposase/recombinase [Actinoplanes sp. NPDC049118]|uniref:DDE-type integrase/transposase/recombinase n=1 Tax=Actinoplanes sp. NPDC049118 TaxID=3155769 RepID=UPI0033EFEAA9
MIVVAVRWYLRYGLSYRDVEELLAEHGVQVDHVEQYANNRIEADHGQLKRRLRPTRGLQTDRTAQAVIAGHAFLQNLRRGHDELGVDTRPPLRVAAAFAELARAI